MFRRRLLCCCFALLALVVLAKAAEEQAPRTLRVLTYNIHHGEGTDGKLDLERIAQVIKASNPDLVALQEIDQHTRRTGDVDQTARLGELTGLHSVFGKAMDFQGGAYGLALLARWPVIASRTHPLPADEGIEPRAVLEAHVRIAEGAPELTVLVTHLDHRSDPALRTDQANRLREFFPPGAKGDPMILAGDLNARPESAVIKGLLADWTDSASGQRFATSPASAPRSKIDYILYRPASRWRLVETRALEESVASDHRPVLAVLELRH